MTKQKPQETWKEFWARLEKEEAQRKAALAEKEKKHEQTADTGSDTNTGRLRR
jgi:hypothetical protein